MSGFQIQGCTDDGKVRVQLRVLFDDPKDLNPEEVMRVGVAMLPNLHVEVDKIVADNAG